MARGGRRAGSTQRRDEPRQWRRRRWRVAAAEGPGAVRGECRRDEEATARGQQGLRSDGAEAVRRRRGGGEDGDDEEEEGAGGIDGDRSGLSAGGYIDSPV